MAKRKPKREQTPAVPQTAGWETAAGRVRWLVTNRFAGNRSALAEAINFSHTAINKVVSGDREPGRKLLEAIARELHVDSTWLLTGNGRPFLEPPENGGRSEIPVSQVLLPGPPMEHQDLLTHWVDVAYEPSSHSQYWLALTSSQPILRDPARGFLVGDRLLMETDRAKFPREKKLFAHLCVVRFPGAESPLLRLAAVTQSDEDEEGPTRLEAHTFDLEPQNLIREEVYWHYPGGEVKHFRRPARIIRRQDKEWVIPDLGLTEPAVPTIRYTDIVAVWLNVFHRPSGVFV